MVTTVGFHNKIAITLCNAYFIFSIESFLFFLFLLNSSLLGFCGGGGDRGSNGRGNECCHCTSTVSAALLPLCRAVTFLMVYFYDLGKSPFQKLPVLDMIPKTLQLLSLPSLQSILGPSSVGQHHRLGEHCHR